jgi:hypothetical protein
MVRSKVLRRIAFMFTVGFGKGRDKKVKNTRSVEGITSVGSLKKTVFFEINAKVKGKSIMNSVMLMRNSLKGPL